MVRTLIFSDLHSRDPTDLAEAMLMSREVDKIAFLGDFGNYLLFERILQFRKDFAGVPMVIIMGNHDYHYANGQRVSSKSSELSPEELVGQWSNSGLKGKILCPTKRIWTGETIRDRSLLYSHAGLSGSVDYEGVDPRLWTRLILPGGVFYDENIRSNFNSMAIQEAHIKFRGHDHYPAVFSQDIKDPRDSFKVSLDKIVKLEEGHRHIVSVGAFYDGNYTIFDEDSSVVEFRKQEVESKI
jgi:hypothetical protein